MNYTIGQLAKLSGVTVRALRHYEKRGLLPPSGRTGSGYRRYTERDVLRLHRIVACRQMGMQLKDVAPYLQPDAPPLQTLLTQQAAAIEAELERLQRLLSILRRIAAVAQGDAAHDLSDELLRLMNAMQSIQQHYTVEELGQLHALRDTLTPAALHDAKIELADLLEQFGRAQSLGSEPTHGDVADLARRWIELGRSATSAESLRAKTRSLIDSEPAVQRATGITPSLKAYIDEAVAAVRSAAD